MIREFKVGQSRLGIIAGESRSIITETDCCHWIVDNDSFDELMDWYTGQAHTLPIRDIIAKAKPVSVPDWVHYFGIKDRVLVNYQSLLKSMRKIGVATDTMPTWDKKLRAGFAA